MGKANWLAGAIACTALTGCGGGSGSTGVSVVSAAPTPTPSPSATATPTPAASYDAAFDLSRDRTLGLIGAEVSAVGTQAAGASRYAYDSIAGRLLDALISPTLAYAVATQQTALAINNGAATLSYDRSQLTSSTSDRLIYQPPTGFFAWYQPTMGQSVFVPLRYVSVVVQSQQVRNAAGGLDLLERRLVGGSATVTAEVPQTGTGSYVVELSSYLITPGETSTPTNTNARLSVDFAGRTIGGTITATSTAGPPLTVLELTFAGQLSTGSNRFSGTVTTPDGGSGRFTGQFYGVAGNEVGFAYGLQRGDQRLAGTVVGLRR